MSMRIVKPNTFRPWYKQTKNKFLREKSYFDIDRSGNMFMLDVHESENKDGEVVRDIMRVVQYAHIDDGGVQASGGVWMLIHENFACAWPRCLESGDIRQCAVWLQKQIDAGKNGFLLQQYLNQVNEYLEKNHAV